MVAISTVDRLPGQVIPTVDRLPGQAQSTYPRSIQAKYKDGRYFYR
jgi:hypothetical protein